MFHKIKSVSPLPDFKLTIQFCEGVTKLYDMKPLGHRKCIFRGGFLRGIGCVGIGRGTVRRLYLCGERRGNHADSQHQNQKKCDTSF